jgi:ADP-ribose pyrophosphatase YjhB (NUDIX family)
MIGTTAEYDVFLSYARIDDSENEHYVEHLVNELASVYRRQVGRELRVFFDRQAIVTAQEWEREIRNALSRSSIMVAVLSPAYFSSPWCGREWDTFIRANQERSILHGITPYLKLIFPVTLSELTWVDQGSPEMRRRIREARALQHVDFAGVSLEGDQFTELASRLVNDITDALQRLGQVTHGHGAWLDATLPAPSAESPTITTRRAQDSHQFIRVLADAINVTVVGVTNENLGGFLREALELKRRRLGTHAFWESLRIVFLREDLLDLVNDQLEAQRPGARETFRKRKQRAKAGKRAVVSFLVRQNQPEKWSLHEYNYYLPFLGGLFGMADGTNLVQITMARPRHSVGEALYFEFVDPADHYFANAFLDIVADSREENEVVLVGAPDEDSVFYVNGARFRRSALRDLENADEWLPSVAVVTWSVRSGAATPVLQVRTHENSTHYIHHLSHVGGYINENDLLSAGVEIDWPSGSHVRLPSAAAHNAARRELREQLDLAVSENRLESSGTCRFRSYGRESLFFHLFTLQLPDIQQFPSNSGVRAWRIEDLIRLHRYQVLSKAQQLLEADLSAGQRTDAARIIAQQLTLHGQPDLGARLVGAARRPTVRLTEQFRRLAAQNTVQLRLAGHETTLMGLAEIHYREFFSTLLPLYARVGVAGARRVLAELERADGAADARARLSEDYEDDDLMSSLPFDV